MIKQPIKAYLCFSEEQHDGIPVIAIEVQGGKMLYHVLGPSVDVNQEDQLEIVVSRKEEDVKRKEAR